MFVIILIYVCVRYLQTLLPEHTRLLALIGLLMTLLSMFGVLGGPLLRGGS